MPPDPLRGKFEKRENVILRLLPAVEATSFKRRMGAVPPFKGGAEERGGGFNSQPKTNNHENAKIEFDSNARFADCSGAGRREIAR